MKKTIFLFIPLITILSCKKSDKNSFEKMNGNYTAILYKWTVNNNQEEQFDTLYNQLGTLEINDDSDLVRFNGIEYTAHNSLKESYGQDSLRATMMVGRTGYDITINKNSKTIKYYESWGAPIGPSKGRTTGEYIKQ